MSEETTVGSKAVRSKTVRSLGLLATVVVGLAACAVHSPGTAGRPIPLTWPADADALDKLEGAVVTMEGVWTIADVYALGRFGRLGLVASGRPFHPTNHQHPAEASAVTVEARAAMDFLVLDDGSDAEHPHPVPYLIADAAGARPPRVGDRVEGLVGRLTRDERGTWVLQPTARPRLVVANPRPPAPPAVGGSLRVAAFNVLNYFETLDVRGATNAAELVRQRQKLLAALTRLDAEILALIEIENTPGAVASLTASLAVASGQPWRAAPAPAGGLGDDVIRVALVYRADRVRVEGLATTAAEPVFGTRYPMAQTFVYGQGAAAERFTVAVAHLKSKGGCDRATGADADQRDGQGCWNDLRTRQTHRLASWVETLVASSGDADVLLLGDLNAYGKEDPIRTLVEAGMVDTGARFLAPTDRYSYVYRGRSGTLDYALATKALAPRVAGMAIWHINADEAPILDYNTETHPPALFRADPYRSSDHDPVIVGLSF